MAKENNKGERNQQTNKRYKKRVRRFVNNLDIYVNKKGERINKPKAVDVIKESGQQCLKHQGTPCSCYGCSQRKSRHDRSKDKNNFKNELKEYFKSEKGI